MKETENKVILTLEYYNKLKEENYILKNNIEAYSKNNYLVMYDYSNGSYNSMQGLVFNKEEDFLKHSSIYTSLNALS